MKHKQPAASAALGVVFSTEVLRRIRQHARSSMSAEICGVLIGEMSVGATVVEAAIEGEDTQQGGSHVTFTQDTWSHIYAAKDSKYPEKRIVGWYHSHPGFGVFLSDHDTFIQRNFFSDPGQVAWVYDPHSDEEGCFSWEGNQIVRLPHIALRDEPAAEGATQKRVEEPLDAGGAFAAPSTPEPQTRGRTIVRALLLVLSHILALILGFGISLLLLPRVIVVRDGAPPFDVPAAPDHQNK